MGAWFEAKILEVFRDQNYGHHQRHGTRPLSSSMPSTGISAQNPGDSQKNVDIVESDSADGSEESGSTDKENSAKDSNDRRTRETEQTGEVNECVLKDENCNEDKSSMGMQSPSKKDTPMDVGGDSSNFDEPDSCEVQVVKKVDSSTVLTPKKMSNSKENTVEATASPASRSLFKKETSDDLKKQGILCETSFSDGYIYKVVFDG